MEVASGGRRFLVQHGEAHLSVVNATEVQAFQRDGFVGPYRAFSESTAAHFRDMIEREVLTADGPDPKSRLQSRHLDSPTVYALCSAPPVVDRVVPLLGPDLILWRSNFFEKTARSSALAWHRDSRHWRTLLVPMINVSAWLAIDAATRDNGCVRLLPGSHNEEYRANTNDPKFVDASSVDETRAVDLELKPGEFFLFSSEVLHASPENTSGVRRLGLAIRFTVPNVRVDHDAILPNHRCMLLCGRDSYGYNRLTAAPAVQRTSGAQLA